MIEYTVLHDGPEVAGMKSPGIGKTIMLNDKQAEHPLRLGQIVKTTVVVLKKTRD